MRPDQLHTRTRLQPMQLPGNAQGLLSSRLKSENVVGEEFALLRPKGQKAHCPEHLRTADSFSCFKTKLARCSYYQDCAAAYLEHGIEAVCTLCLEK